jgi:hypothetical protein
MLADIKLGVLSDDEVQEILNIIRYEEQLLFLKKTDNNEYYLTIESDLCSTEEDPDYTYICTPFFDCYFIDLYCPPFVFITYSKKRGCFVSSHDIEGCEIIDKDVDEICLDNENLYTGIYEILPLDNFHLEESEQIEIVKNFIKNYNING